MRNSEAEAYPPTACCKGLSPEVRSSRAGVCPGNYESAGKSPSGRTRPGDPWLKGVLGQAAISACRTKDTCLAARY
ncbi:transposase [Streptomyces mirabilis]|uniref:transposase n=1 Tax=Streptomyces mirabilis TaxID=68239 RepID=UPI00364DB667